MRCAVYFCPWYRTSSFCSCAYERSGERDFFFGTHSFRHIEIIKQRHTYTVHTVLYLKRRQTRVFFVFHSAVAVGVVIIWTVAHNTRNKNKIARFRLQFVTRSSTFRLKFFSLFSLCVSTRVSIAHTHIRSTLFKWLEIYYKYLWWTWTCRIHPYLSISCARHATTFNRKNVNCNCS